MKFGKDDIYDISSNTLFVFKQFTGNTPEKIKLF